MNSAKAVPQILTKQRCSLAKCGEVDVGGRGKYFLTLHCLPVWQYFQGRLAGTNSSAETLSANHTSPTDTFNFNNWVTLLSQLPLLLFTLLNSFLYQW